MQQGCSLYWAFTAIFRAGGVRTNIYIIYIILYYIHWLLSTATLDHTSLSKAGVNWEGGGNCIEYLSSCIKAIFIYIGAVLSFNISHNSSSSDEMIGAYSPLPCHKNEETNMVQKQLHIWYQCWSPWRSTLLWPQRLIPVTSATSN